MSKVKVSEVDNSMSLSDKVATLVDSLNIYETFLVVATNDQDTSKLEGV